jgi:hypothetical protein
MSGSLAKGAVETEKAKRAKKAKTHRGAGVFALFALFVSQLHSDKRR